MSSHSSDGARSAYTGLNRSHHRTRRPVGSSALDDGSLPLSEGGPFAHASAPADATHGGIRSRHRSSDVDGHGGGDRLSADRHTLLFPPTPPSRFDSDQLGASGWAAEEEEMTTPREPAMQSDRSSSHYEHVHVSELEKAVQAWRERTLRVAIDAVGMRTITPPPPSSSASVSQRKFGGLASSAPVGTDGVANDHARHGRPQRADGADKDRVESSHSPDEALAALTARVAALDEENARLSDEVALGVRQREVLDHALADSAGRAERLATEVGLAGAYIDELEARLSRPPSQSATALEAHDSGAQGAAMFAVPPKEGGDHFSDSDEADASLHTVTPPDVPDCLRELARVTCTTAEVCGALQKRCAQMVGSFSALVPSPAGVPASDAHTGSQVIFSGLDCAPSAELLALARAPGGVASPASGGLTARVHDGTLASLVRQWGCLRQSLEVAAEAVGASSKMHITREHTLQALTALCERQKKELQAASAVAAQDIPRLEALVADQAARLAVLQKAKGELSETNRALRHQLDATQTSQGQFSASVSRPAECAALQHECDCLTALVQAQRARIAQLESLAQAPTASPRHQQPSVMPSSPPVARARGRLPLQTPSLAHAPLAVVDAVYTTALESTDTAPSPAGMHVQSAVSHARGSSPGHLARRAAAAATAATLFHGDEQDGDDDTEVGNRDGRVTRPGTVAGAHGLATSIYARARRWEEVDPSAHTGALPRDPAPPADSSARSPPSRTRQEALNGVVHSTSVSPSPLPSRGVDAWQDRFRAVMEASFDDI